MATEITYQSQHVYLFTDDAAGFYEKIGFNEQQVGMSKVVGQWLQGNIN